MAERGLSGPNGLQVIRVTIVEDNDAEAALLEGHLERYAKDHGIACEVSRVASALDFGASQRVADLIFLDIGLPGMSGMEVARLIRSYDEETPIIFTTSLAQYAVSAWEVDALDFIVKPVRYRDLALRLDRAMRVLRRTKDRVLYVTAKDAVHVMPVVFFDIAFDMAVKRIASLDVPLQLVLILLLAHLGACVLILFISYEMLFSRRLVLESRVAEQMMREREQQYQASRENIDAINVKCHDIRHQIRALGGTGAVDPDALEDIAREVNVYDATFDTGSDALDTILTEKALVCDKAGIRLTCIADGTALSFLSPAELYALFGNMLDNAIEATSGLPEEDRAISLRVQEKFGMAGVHIENRYEGEVRFADGLPQTTKGDTVNHGFGLRSMRGIVARHGGTMTVRAEDGVFSLNALVPVA